LKQILEKHIPFEVMSKPVREFEGNKSFTFQKGLLLLLFSRESQPFPQKLFVEIALDSQKKKSFFCYAKLD